MNMFAYSGNYCLLSIHQLCFALTDYYFKNRKEKQIGCFVWQTRRRLKDNIFNEKLKVPTFKTQPATWGHVRWLDWYLWFFDEKKFCFIADGRPTNLNIFQNKLSSSSFSRDEWGYEYEHTELETWKWQEHPGLFSHPCGYRFPEGG